MGDVLLALWAIAGPLFVYVVGWARERRLRELCDKRLYDAVQIAELLIYERARGPDERRQRVARDFVRYKPPEYVIDAVLGRCDDG